MKIKLVLPVFISLLFINCGKDDGPAAPNPDPNPSPVVQAPTVALSTTSLTTTLEASGSFEAPNINWNNDVGTIEISGLESDESETVNGITLNETTGEVSWDGTIPLGKTYIELTFTNGEGSATLDLQLDNTLAGAFFAGNFNDDPENDELTEPLYFEFLASGEVIVYHVYSSTLIPALGSWSRDGNNLDLFYHTGNNKSSDPRINTLEIQREGGDVTSIAGIWNNEGDSEPEGLLVVGLSEKPQVKAPLTSSGMLSTQAEFFKGKTTNLQLVDWGWEWGTTEVTDIDWPNAEEVQGILIDSDTGNLVWDNTLPLGDIPLTITFTNSAGQANLSITIKNSLFGTGFSGGFNSDPEDADNLSIPLSLSFKGTAEVNIDDGGVIYSGLAYEVGENTVNLSYDTPTSTIYYQLQLVNNQVDLPYFEGFWYRNGLPPAESAEGYIKIILVQDEF